MIPVSLLKECEEYLKTNLYTIQSIIHSPNKREMLYNVYDHEEEVYTLIQFDFHRLLICEKSAEKYGDNRYYIILDLKKEFSESEYNKL